MGLRLNLACDVEGWRFFGAVLIRNRYNGGVVVAAETWPAYGAHPAGNCLQGSNLQQRRKGFHPIRFTICIVLN